MGMGVALVASGCAPMPPSMPERPSVYALASQRPSLLLHHHGRQVRTHANFPELVEGESWMLDAIQCCLQPWECQ